MTPKITPDYRIGPVADRQHPAPSTDPTTISGLPIKQVYTPEDIGHIEFLDEIGHPGQFPYTRGIHADMYRTKVWTMRQFAGFGSAAQTNERFKYLLEHGQTGLSTAFDLPTLMGRDSDDPLSLGEVGKCGVAISSLEDMRVLFDGIRLDQVSTSMTINAPAAILLAFYICVARDQGVPLSKLRGTLQNDILKEFHAQNEFVFPPGPSVKLVVDTIEYGTQHMPQWNTVSVSGYHIREAGATAVQELAFTLADGICYVQESIKRGLDVDAFAPRLSFFWDVHNEFFEEVAKFRAARRMWARIMRDRFGAKSERSWWLRTHAQTAGVSLTEQQPLVNVIRVAYQALAAVLGGTQSLHTNSMDETLALPTEQAVKVALRTQQIIAEETGVTRTVDPLGGSYFVEALTSEVEKRAWEIIEHVDELGGVLPAIEQGYFRRSIADSSHRFGQEFDAGQRVMVGVNKYVDDDYERIPTLVIDESVEREQVARLRAMRARRAADPAARERHRRALAALQETARSGGNVMPALIEASEALATVGEMMNAMKDVFGSYDGAPEW
ncbi:MAG: methylmalonyl-CoA mutase family protein [Phycisphaerae bacterium]|nr:methylmalonyl-CoA mutase family protein [Phycisphaerae bacterium]MCZ2398393.1 methylmalonyl-CoA mutase family protein [Phycisphaerae bacterium]